MAADQQKDGRRRILVYQLGGIGDTVVTIPALKAIRRHFGSQVEIWLVHEIKRNINVTPTDILAGNAIVDRWMGYPYEAGLWGKLGILPRLWRQIASKRFEAVIYLAPSERPAASVERDRRFFQFCGIRRTVGFHAFDKDFLYPVDGEGMPAVVMHEALCRLDRLRKDGIDVTVESDLSEPFLELLAPEIAASKRWLNTKRSYPDRQLVAICPGAKKPANVWPVERLVEIGSRLVASSRFEVLVVGGPTEQDAGEQMVAAWGAGINAAGHFSVLGSAALLSHCAFMVGLDTGTTHMAAALGVTCVVLFSQRDNPGRFEPLGLGHVVLRHSVPCAGCGLIMAPCPVEGHPCMMGIHVEDVWQAIQQVKNGLDGERA